MAFFRVIPVCIGVSNIVQYIDNTRKQAKNDKTGKRAQDFREMGRRKLAVEDERGKNHQVFYPLAWAHGFEESFQCIHWL